ncbi:hypothetical protein SeMB42_g05589 [Synchytrium endobioticum]|uniref:Pre-mRNA-splicing factor 18 n=1 Tax=Synchytrium endobioticum TaxID=286115 RepID=A0A507CQN8_9FUNG|nr:hypothetical protein SeMB42_g05589 [Synchytrium endobioticum]TPX43061.1 hypothetical protein SeLEV6574_g05265 [Synchytrium endobioticum]
MADFLSKEIERKRKERDELTLKLGSQDKKYFKKADLEKLREDEYRKEQERKEAERLAKLGISTITDSRDRSSSSPSQVTRTRKSNSTATPEIDDDYLLPDEDVVRRLRAIDQPIRLFAETDKERIKRLRSLESQYEERGGREGQRNDWRKALEATNKEITSALLMKSNSDTNSSHDNEGSSKKRKQDKEENIDTTPISLGLYEKEPEACRKLIRIYIKRMVKEWEDDLLSRDDHFKSSQQGRLQITTMNQSLEYMKPFFKGLKKRDVPVDVEARLAEICHWVQKREYQLANDVYLRMSIGNAPWPIGVTMVGIHERSGREKIFSSNVAHALNDETQRKWIQSLKRLMTWLQQKYPPDDLAKLMG